MLYLFIGETGCSDTQQRSRISDGGAQQPSCGPKPVYIRGTPTLYIVNHYLYKDDAHPATGTIRLATQEGPLEILHPSPSG